MSADPSTANDGIALRHHSAPPPPRDAAPKPTPLQRRSGIALTAARMLRNPATSADVLLAYADHLDTIVDEIADQRPDSDDLEPAEGRLDGRLHTMCEQARQVAAALRAVAPIYALDDAAGRPVVVS